MNPEPDLQAFSKNRLGGEPVPDDLRLLIGRAEDLFEKTFLTLNGEERWSPWLETSYLRPEERIDPNIVANLRAIEEVCRLIAFVGAYEDEQYLGYWLGPTHRQVSGSPVVLLDHEGQFELIPGSNIAEATLWLAGEGGQFDDLRMWMQSIGVGIRCNSIDDLEAPDEPNLPSRLHEELFNQYRA